MAGGDYSNFKIYEDEFRSGVIEVLAQNLDGFNAASRNAIRLVSKRLAGFFTKESFFQNLPEVISYRDLVANEELTDLSVTQDEHVTVKLHRMIGPLKWTRDSLRKISTDPKKFSYTLGKLIGNAKMADYFNTALLAAETAIEGVPELNFDNTLETTKTLTHTALVNGLALFGDQSKRIVAWVTHSKPFFDLMKQSISDRVFGVANMTIIKGSVASLDRPILLSDSPALIDSNGSGVDTYNVLGLTADAVSIIESELGDTESEHVLGEERGLGFRVQGEHAFNVRLKGFKWDIINGGDNPEDATLGTSTNWDPVASDPKDFAGVRIIVR